MTSLNIPRIIAFAVILFVLRLAVSAVIGFVTGGSETQTVLQYVLEYLLDAIIVIAVFAKLAKVQVQRPYAHAFLVVVLQELLGIALTVAIFKKIPPSPLWPLDYFVLALSVLAGMWLGQKLRITAEKKQNA